MFIRLKNGNMLTDNERSMSEFLGLPIVDILYDIEAINTKFKQYGADYLNSKQLNDSYLLECLTNKIIMGE